MREFVNIPHDSDEDYLFNNLNKLNIQNSSQFLNQIFERIRVLINNSGTSLVTGGMGDTTINGGLKSSMSNQLVNNLKLDAQKPFSIILKHIVLSGIDGFQSVTNELMDYLKTAVGNEKQDGFLIRFSAHLALFYHSASFQIKVRLFLSFLNLNLLLKKFLNLNILQIE